MARNTIYSLLQRAIPHAILDRESLVDAYSGAGKWAEDAMATATSLKALTGVKFRSMSPAQLQLAAEAFIYGEQWEQSFADSGPGEPYESTARANAKLYREFRIKHWGQTRLESSMANAKLVDVRDVFAHVR